MNNVLLPLLRTIMSYTTWKIKAFNTYKKLFNSFFISEVVQWRRLSCDKGNEAARKEYVIIALMRQPNFKSRLKEWKLLFNDIVNSYCEFLLERKTNVYAIESRILISRKMVETSSKVWSSFMKNCANWESCNEK